MDSILEEIKALQAKKEKALTLLTVYKTQLEGVVQGKEELVKKLNDTYGTTVDGAVAKLAELKEQRDKLLDEAKKALDKITL